MTFEVLQHCTLRRTNPAKMLAKTLTLAQLIINLLMLHICILGSTNGRMVEWQNSWIAGWQDGRMCCARFLSSHRSSSSFPFLACAYQQLFILTTAVGRGNGFWGGTVFRHSPFPISSLLLLPQHISFSSLCSDSRRELV